MAFDGIVRVYNKNKQLLATFSGESEGCSESAMQQGMVSPTVRLVQNGESTLSFQMLANSEKFQQIKNPENLYYLNGRWYTALNESSYIYSGNEGVRVCNVVLTEIWSLLSRKYIQAYNCGIYCYAKGTFTGYTTDGATFTVNASNCSNPGGTISALAAWEQVKTWLPKDEKGNQNVYAILTSDKYKPTNWDDAPTSVLLKSVSISENTATFTIESKAKNVASKVFPYNDSSNQYKLDITPIPSSVSSVKINLTMVAEGENGNQYTTSEKEVNYTYNASSGVVMVDYIPEKGEKINAVAVTYSNGDLGTIKAGATCTFAFGPEAVDEHTFVILPKAKEKYKLTINGNIYEDSQVKDSRGVVMPRGSGGYAMWVALRDSGWSLGVCDVIAKDFDPSIDYGCFNIESDMQDVLYNIQYIQQLYGGILDWDSEHKVLNYRAENSEHYQAYNDDFNRWKGYEFREGKNMLEVPEVSVDNNIITRAYLLGYGNLNIRNVNSGKSYIENFSFSDTLYEGYLEQPLIYDTRDEGGQRQLLYWGQKELAKRCRPRKTINLSVTDLRTTPKHSHEIFDINDIVKVYYRDEEGNKQIVEEQRVISWEYNAFAMWDCSVELGERTMNETELFKLVYNNSISLPGSNASGNISSSKVDMGNGWGDDMYYGDESSLQHYIELIARTTTENSDAIAGLILDTSETHAQVDLFAMYQKQTDELFTEAYAGLQLYADEKKAEAILSAEKYTERVTSDLQGNVTQQITQSAASLRVYADEKKAEAIQQATFESQRYVNGQLVNYTTTSAMNSAIATERDARVQMEARFNNQLAGYATTATVNAIASNVSAQATMMTQFQNELTQKANIAYVDTYVDDRIARIDIGAEVESTLSRSHLVISGGNITVSSPTFTVSSGTAEYSSTTIFRGSVYMDCPFYFGGYEIKRKSYYMTDGNTLYYLGFN